MSPSPMKAGRSKLTRAPTSAQRAAEGRPLASDAARRAKAGLVPAIFVGIVPFLLHSTALDEAPALLARTFPRNQSEAAP
jgi:hypothetical protein